MRTPRVFAFSASGDVGAAEDRLDHLDVAVAELRPEELVERVRRLVEAVRLEGRVHAARRVREAREDPAVDRGEGRGARGASASAQAPSEIRGSAKRAAFQTFVAKPR